MPPLGLTTGKRSIRDGSALNHLFPSEANSYRGDSVIAKNGDMQDTVAHIARII